MSHRVLIVEDESLVALELEAVIEDLGLQPVGIAPDSKGAFALVNNDPDIALVDINLRDGATGIEIGKRLSSEFGIKVLFVTANPRMLGDGIPGTFGVLSKPYDAEDVQRAIAVILGWDGRAPSTMRIFADQASA